MARHIALWRWPVQRYSFDRMVCVFSSPDDNQLLHPFSYSKISSRGGAEDWSFFAPRRLCVSSFNQHRVAIAEETVALGDGVLVDAALLVEAGQGGD